jgi:predicted sulfurtransferase
MLDTRNLQEVEYGTFKDALVLPFTSSPTCPRRWRRTARR